MIRGEKAQRKRKRGKERKGERLRKVKGKEGNIDKEKELSV